MEVLEFVKAVKEHNKKNGSFQILLNSGDVEDKAKNRDVEFADIYFSECKVFEKENLLAFGNGTRVPISYKGDGTAVYPQEINSCLFVRTTKIEQIEECLPECEDWFSFPSEKIFNLYMYPQSGNDGRNVVTVGFLK